MLFLMIRLYSSEMRVIIVTGMNPFEFVYILQIFFMEIFRTSLMLMLTVQIIKLAM